MADDLPFRAEYAKSGRAACKACKGKIDKDNLRLAKMTQSPMFDGKVPNWFHVKCFFGKRSVVKNVDDIADFDQLRWEDQEMIRKNVEGAGKEFLAAQLSSSDTPLEDYTTEYAKSNRSVCRGCNEKIDKGVLRISKKEYDSPRAIQHGPQDLWYHVDCFVKDREELDFYAAADKIKGFKGLKDDDKDDLKKKLPLVKNAEAKRAASTSSTQPAKKQKTQDPKEDKLKVQLQEQTDLLYKYRDQLKDLAKKELQYLLEHNDQGIPSGESKLLDCLTDCMAFGKLLPCPECKNGQLVYQREGYRCTGNMSEWTKCTYITKDVKRQKFEVPSDLKDEYDFLKKYKYKAQERVFPPEAAPSATSAGTSSSGNSSSTSSSLPLSDMKFFVLGKLKKSKGDITKAVEELGGTITSKIDKHTAAILSTEAEVKKMSKKMQEAKDANIQVVAEDFLDSVKKGGAVLLIRDKAICSWGSDPLERIGNADSKLAAKKRKAEESMYTKSVPAKLLMKVKGAAAVDPDSKLDHVAHVLEENKNIYNAVLGLVDIEKGTNSFYKLQLLEADSGNREYWLFRAWGRVGTTIGGKKVETKTTKSEAIKSFCDVYLEKTGNHWKDRDNFKKQPRKFYPLDIDYGQDDENVKKLSAAASKSKLHKSIQELVCMIFDVESMKKAMVEFELDLKKMPLGKLSRKQIENAYTVLTELMQLIQSGGTPAKFLDASNRFYTLIPHDFGMKKPTPLDNEEIIKQKIEMLDNLLEIEVAYSMLKGAEGDKSKDVIDVHYEKLKTDLEYLEKETEDFKRMKDYVKNTHAATHNQYDLEVMEAFKVNRHGERARFKPFRQLHNRKLLWHGSRVTNFAGILSQGLRIAPPEAPVTGYMFGKGVYFADMVSKSANYCCAYKNNPIGIMLLCEVALGNMHELTHSDFITKLPAGKHSTKGVGRTAPDPSKSVKQDDGVEIPLGPGITAPAQSTSLLYNEYIVYDVAQINIKYLLKMNFKWKY